MLKSSVLLLGLAISVLPLLTVSCGSGSSSSSGDGAASQTLQFSISGFPDLGDTGHYHAWIAYDTRDPQTGQVTRDVVSLRKFRVFGNGPDAAVVDPFAAVSYGSLRDFRFQLQALPPINLAAVVFITFEQADDRDNAPSRNILLSGVFSPGSSSFELTVAGPPGFGIGDLSEASGTAGTFTIFSPTDGFDGDFCNESLGVWFVNPDPNDPNNLTGVSRPSALSLPQLPKGWVYETWIATGPDVPVSLGRFRDAKNVDEDYSTFPGRGELNTGPRAPGQDLVNEIAFLGITATNLTDTPRRVRITVEPFPDNNLAPFQLEILRLEIPEGIVDMDGVSAMTPRLELSSFGLPTARAVIEIDQVSLTSIVLDDLRIGAIDIAGEVDEEETVVGLYGLWAVLNGEPTCVGRFHVRGRGSSAVLRSEFLAENYGNLTVATIPTSQDFRQATEIFITIEPFLIGAKRFSRPGVSLPPSPSRILAGPVDHSTPTPVADLTVSGAIRDFRTVSGRFFLKTPTDDVTNMMANDGFGCWFPSLDLPVLPEGWIYEAFIEELDGSNRLSTGKFKDPSVPDSNRYLSRTRGPDNRGFFFPGEDFTNSAGTVTITVESTIGIRLSTIFITVEPEPDNSPNPFFIQPLTQTIPLNVDSAQMVNTSLFFPSGSARSLTPQPSGL